MIMHFKFARIHSYLFCVRVNHHYVTFVYLFFTFPETKNVAKTVVYC